MLTRTLHIISSSLRFKLIHELYDMMKKKKQTKVLLGNSYSGERHFIPYEDGLHFRLKPRKLPILKLIINLIVFQFFGCGMSAFLYSQGNKVNQIIPGFPTYLIPAIFLVFISILYVAFMYFDYKREQKKGDVLIYNIKNKVIKLPRQNIEIPVSEVFMQVVTGWFGTSNKSKVAELHLILKEDTSQRWLILTSISSFKNAFDYITCDIRNSIPIEIKK